MVAQTTKFSSNMQAWLHYNGIEASNNERRNKIQYICIPHLDQKFMHYQTREFNLEQE